MTDSQPLHLGIETKKEILRAAQQAPTGDNSQHWRFEFEGNRLLIYYLVEDGRHVLNEHFTASYISLETVIESIKIISSKFKLETQEEIFLENFGKDYCCSIGFRSAQMVEDELIPFVYLRETNRKTFATTPVPSEIFESINNYAQKFNLRVVGKSKPSSRSKKYLKKCDLYIFVNKLVFLDTTRWMRFSDKEIKATKDGFGMKNLNLNNIDGFFIKILKKFIFLLPLGYLFGIRWKQELNTFFTLRGTGSFLAFVGRKDNLIDLVNTGRVAFRTWLKLSEIGYSAQPLSLSRLLPYDLEVFGKMKGFYGI